MVTPFDPGLSSFQAKCVIYTHFARFNFVFGPLIYQ